MEKIFKNLANFIKEKSNGKTIYYLANPGNFGDGLIREGTLKFFKDFDIKYKEINPKLFRLKALFLKKNSIFIYGGGGAWCKNWNHALFFVSLISKKIETIVLPSSYESNYEYLNNVTFFRRDKYNSKINMPNSIFCHDMAFYIGKIDSKVKKQKNKGFFYRIDNESSKKIKIPKNNLDISSLGNQYDNINNFIDEIDKYKIIYTDRLHVGIASAILGKEVHLYGSNYFKIYDIYKSSLKNNFKNVIFEKIKEKN